MARTAALAVAIRFRMRLGRPEGRPTLSFARSSRAQRTETAYPVNVGCTATGWAAAAPAAWMLPITQVDVLSPGVSSSGVTVAVFDTVVATISFPPRSEKPLP